ncbi:hypothetical protein [Acaryochloris sp. IP29b_bin.137]|nr:hypothetical protein [Acaryochloris sp. IP29b_bin.137]
MSIDSAGSVEGDKVGTSSNGSDLEGGDGDVTMHTSGLNGADFVTLQSSF